MPIRITCPSCSATLSVKDENAGRAVKCPKCDGVIPVPSPAAPPPPPAAPSSPKSGAFDDLDDEPAPKIKGAMAKSSSRSSSPAKSKGKSYRDDDDDDDDDDYDDRPRSRSRPRSGGEGGMGDFLTFRKMIVPVVIQIIFWFLVLVVLGVAAVFAIMSLASGESKLVIATVAGLLIGVPLYILLIRMYCEVLIVIFRMNDTLTEIRDALTRRD